MSHQNYVGKWVKITWHDAADDKRTWMKGEEIDSQPVEVKSAGYVVEKTRKVKGKSYYVLAGDLSGSSEDRTYGRVTQIPVGMVVEIREDK